MTEGEGGGALLWAQSCRQVEGERGSPWPEPEAAALYALVVGGPTGPDTGGLEHAARAFATATGSIPLLARRLGVLRQVVFAVASQRGLDPGRLAAALDRVTVTATQAALTQLEDAALTDALTETGNRRALEQAARAALATAARSGQPLSVVAIDLDGLKTINDSQGHAAGDRALAGLSAAVRAALRATDQLFRIGGDEFVVLLPLASSEMVGELVQRMQMFNAPKFSWGAATTPMDGVDLETLLRVADARLYESRRATGYRRDNRALVPPMAMARRGIAHHWGRAAAVAGASMAGVAILAFLLGAVPGTPKPSDGTTPGVQSPTTVPASSGGSRSGGGGSGHTTTTGGRGGTGSTSTNSPTGGGGTGGGTGGAGDSSTTTRPTTTTTAPLITVPTTLPTTTLPLSGSSKSSTTTTTSGGILGIHLPPLRL